MDCILCLYSSHCLEVIVTVMSGKGCVCADEEPKDKRKRKVMSVALDWGISIVAV